MSTWTPERGVLLLRPRLHGRSVRRIVREEWPFPWLALPLLGAGFLAFFAALALMGESWRPWEPAVLGLGVGLVVAGVALLASFFHRAM